MTHSMWPVCPLYVHICNLYPHSVCFPTEPDRGPVTHEHFYASRILHSSFFALNLAIRQSARVCMHRPDKREVLANQVGILIPSRVLCLQQLSTPFDPHYRLATRQDVKQNMLSLCEVMPAWEVAHLGDGWVDGTAYGSKIG